MRPSPHLSSPYLNTKGSDSEGNGGGLELTFGPMTLIHVSGMLILLCLSSLIGGCMRMVQKIIIWFKRRLLPTNVTVIPQFRLHAPTCISEIKQNRKFGSLQLY